MFSVYLNCIISCILIVLVSFSNISSIFLLMDSQFGLDLLTNRKKLKKKVTNEKPLELISQNYSPINLDKIINNLLNNITELIKYRYQLKEDNEELARELVYDLLDDIMEKKIIDFTKKKYLDIIV